MIHYSQTLLSRLTSKKKRKVKVTAAKNVPVASSEVHSAVKLLIHRVSTVFAYHIFWITCPHTYQRYLYKMVWILCAHF